MKKNNKLQKMREFYIRKLAAANNSKEKAIELSDNLFALDLTMYSKNYSFLSIIYNFFAKSVLDNEISLHPEQLDILENIEGKEALILSAPTSFGKTFCIFEYIARKKPKNIFLIVPTLALVDEYMKKIIKKYGQLYDQYNVYTQFHIDNNYDFDNYNIFILTHERVVEDNVYEMITAIDLLVIDEVYKLQSDSKNDRVLVLNIAYFNLARKAKKYVLLAPFIKGIIDRSMLEKKPDFYCTDYSPVVNEIEVIDIPNKDVRYEECNKLLNRIDSSEKTLIYFSTVKSLYNYIDDFVNKAPILNKLDDDVKNFINWAKQEIYEEWCIIKALEHGYTLHNGQIPSGIRKFLLHLYEDKNYNRLLCTSTLLEGVNTSAENIIITCPSRQSNSGDYFTAFDFYNLVGRSGRLNKHLIGKAYYIRTPDGPKFIKNEALKKIRFEITENSRDINIQKDNIENDEEYLEFLKELDISHQSYKKQIGNHFRFDTVKALYKKYKSKLDSLKQELEALFFNKEKGRWELIKILYLIFENKFSKRDITIINELLHKSKKLKTIINKSIERSKYNNENSDVNSLIFRIIYLKSNYIRHEFYQKSKLIKVFLKKDKLSVALTNILDEKVIQRIEYLYHMNSKQKSMLIDIGIYEGDLDKIIDVIGTDFDDITKLKQLIIQNHGKFKNLSFISDYIIREL